MKQIISEERNWIEYSWLDNTYIVYYNNCNTNTL